MSCPAPDRILDYVARQLDGESREAVDAHVDGCAACRLLLGELAHTDLDALGIAPVADPARIGRYEIEARIGEGGMGTVFAAHDPQLDRKVAVKLVHPELAQRGVERLLREGRALARLSHAHVVAVYDAGTDGDQVYVAMELIEGETLAAWLRARPRTWREIAEKFAGAGRGLAAAHRAGIVHRDVKPENVMIDRAGRAKVTDFGLAGLAGRAERMDAGGAAAVLDARGARASRAGDAGGAPVSRESRLTHPGTVLGTPKFMSPEQWAGEDVGPATDQYSLCAALASALFEDTPARAVPRWLRRAIERGKADEPAQRFASSDALVDAIDPARRAARTRRIAGALAGVAVVGAAVIGVLASRAPDATAMACAGAAADRARLWTPIDRVTVAAALHATGVAYAPGTWTRVDTAVLGYGNALATAETALCAQQPRQPDARALFAQGLACLAARRGELASLTDRLRHVTAADVRLAVARVHDLSPVEDCANPRTLAAERAAYATPGGAVSRTAVALAMRAARDASAAGTYREAAVAARRAVELARGFGGTILAKALLVLVETTAHVDSFPAREAAAREAVAIAESVHADELRAQAMVDLLGAMAQAPGREREALVFAPLVEAATARAGKQGAYAASVARARGAAQLGLGQVEAAVGSLRASLAAARRELPPADPRLPEFIYPVGVALGMMRLDAEAVRYHEEAYRVAREVWGADHPSTARFEINLAIKHSALGDYPRALAELTHARALLTGVLAPDAAEHLLILQAIGACYLLQHAHDQALAAYTAIQAVLRAAGRDRSVEMAGSWIDLGDVHHARADYEAAAASYRRAVAALEVLLGTSDARVASPLCRLAEAELAAGRVARARPLLERGLAIYTATAVPAVVLADAQFPLARALWSQPASRARAVELARAAHTAWRTGGPAHAARAAEAAAWLHAHH